MTNLPPDYINQNLAVIQRKHHSETALCSRHRPHGLNAELQGCVHTEKVNAALTNEKEKGKNMLSVRTPPSSTNIFIVRNSYQLSVNFSLRFQWTHLVFTLQQDKTFTQPSLLCCICSTSFSDRGHNDFFFFCCSLCPPVHALNTTVCVINSNITPPFMQPILDLFSCFTSTECLTSAEKRHLLLLAERSLTAVTAVSLPGSTQRGWIRCWVYALYAELLMNMNMCSVSIQLVYPAGCECLLHWVHV